MESKPTFTSRVAIVTGGATGLGRAMSLALLAAGHRVAAMGRSTVSMGELVDAATQAGVADRLLPACGDITSAGDCEDVVAKTLAHFGAVDALINNAGANVPAGSAAARFYEQPIEEWRETFDVNVTGSFLMARLVTPQLVARGWGRIVNQGTTYGTMVRGGYTPYGPSKAALETATVAWAAELAGTGVTVNVILPGGASDTRRIPPEHSPDRSTLIPPEVMGAPVVWLLSPAADGVTSRRITARLWDTDASEEANLAAAVAPAWESR
jgi:NAD(P)-dependent dehydrogenase (short-subunit alcohol dehydrogenase family)